MAKVIHIFHKPFLKPNKGPIFAGMYKRTNE